MSPKYSPPNSTPEHSAPLEAEVRRIAQVMLEVIRSWALPLNDEIVAVDARAFDFGFQTGHDLLDRVQVGSTSRWRMTAQLSMGSGKGLAIMVERGEDVSPEAWELLGVALHEQTGLPVQLMDYPNRVFRSLD